MYGRQGYDRKYVYNALLVYSPPFYKGQSGWMGRMAGGWTFATIFTAGSGTPVEVYTTTGDSEEFGSGDNTNFFSNQNAIPHCALHQRSRLQRSDCRCGTTAS